MTQRLLIAGAGLSAALIAQRLATAHSDVVVTILEASSRPFGEHTWSFHGTDIEKGDWDWIEPLVFKRWAAQSVVFPDKERRFDCSYASLTSEHVREVLQRSAQIRIETGARVVALDATGAQLEDGRRLEADCVIDARGFTRDAALVLGYQKFLGLEVEVGAGHGIDAPVIMDATVDQLDGYRFVYLLPFTPTRILIEDTRYSDGSDLDVAELGEDILAYAKQRGWGTPRVVRRESGVLPIALAFDAERLWSALPETVATVGMRGGFFHPTTGYSLGEGVRVANLVARSWPADSATLAASIRNHALARARDQRFYRLLSRMLFRAARPEGRRVILSHFFRLPQPLIERFYAGRTTRADIAQIFFGRPPVPVIKALSLVSERRFLRATA